MKKLYSMLNKIAFGAIAFILFSTQQVACAQDTSLNSPEQEKVIVDTLEKAQDKTVGEPQSDIKRKSINWGSLIIFSIFILGILVLFPWVIYANLNERIIGFDKDEPEKIKPIEDLTEEQRNEKTRQLINDMKEGLVPYTCEEGDTYYSIQSGKQARLMKRGLDYIATRLCPTDDDLIDESNTLAASYSIDMGRYFCGSWWILGSAIALLVLMAIIDISFVFSLFGLIHIVGMVFYFMASRTPYYLLHKRLKKNEHAGVGKKGIVGAILGGLFVGAAAKHYVSRDKGDTWERDYNAEFDSGIGYLAIITFIAIIVGFFVSFFGIINFVLNYASNVIWPLKSNDAWYKEKYETTIS